MHVSMIWKEQVYNVKDDTAESLSSKPQAPLMFYFFFVISFCVAWFILLNIKLQAMEFKSSAITAASKHMYVVFLTRVFPNPKLVFWLFSGTRNPFFSTTKPGYFKKIGIDVAVKY